MVKPRGGASKDNGRPRFGLAAIPRRFVVTTNLFEPSDQAHDLHGPLTNIR